MSWWVRVEDVVVVVPAQEAPWLLQAALDWSSSPMTGSVVMSAYYSISDFGLLAYSLKMLIIF